MKLLVSESLIVGLLLENENFVDHLSFFFCCCACVQISQIYTAMRAYENDAKVNLVIVKVRKRFSNTMLCKVQTH